jgi:hypothetical protein
LIVTTKPATPMQLLSLGGSTWSVTEGPDEPHLAAPAMTSTHAENAAIARVIAIPP